MDKHLEELKAKEDQKLQEFIDQIKVAYNLAEKGYLGDVLHIKDFEGYEDVLKVKFISGQTGYINISWNSVSASARELVKYLWTKECTGHIRTE